MSNYLETLVENMIADGVPESDIKEVIKEVTKKSPLKQDNVVVGGTESSDTVPGTVVTTTPGTPPQTEVVPTGTQVVSTGVSDDAVAVEEEKVEEKPAQEVTPKPIAEETPEETVDEDDEDIKIPTAEQIYTYMAQTFEDKYSKIQEIQNLIEEDELSEKLAQRQFANILKQGFSENEKLAKEEVKAFTDYLLERGILITPEGDLLTSKDFLPGAEVIEPKKIDYEAAFEDTYIKYSPDKEQARKELDAGVMEQFKTLYNEVGAINENSKEVLDSLAEQYFDTSEIKQRTETQLEHGVGMEYPKIVTVAVETMDEAIQSAWVNFPGKYQEYRNWKDKGTLPEGFKNRFPKFTIESNIQSAKTKIVENAMRRETPIGTDYRTQADAWTRALAALYGSVYEKEFLDEAIRLGERDEKIFSNYCQGKMNIMLRYGFKDGKWVRNYGGSRSMYERWYNDWKRRKEMGLDGWWEVHEGKSGFGRPRENPTRIGDKYLISKKQRLEGWYVDRNGKLVDPTQLDSGKGLARAQEKNILKRIKEDVDYIKKEEKDINKMYDDWKKNYTDVWKERDDIITALNTVGLLISEESTEADRMYVAGLLERLKEIYPEYRKAVELKGKIAARSQLLEYDLYNLQKQIKKSERSQEILTGIKKEFGAWKRFFAQLDKMGKDISVSFTSKRGLLVPFSA